MDPLLQYAITSDGVGIAYWSMGEGQALVIPPIIVSSHLELEWQIVSRRAVYEGLAHDVRVVRYDSRGMGMSQRDVIDFSIDAAIEDLEAVRKRLGLESFSLLRLPSSGDVAFAYAARYPERVANLIVWEGHIVDDQDTARADQLEAVAPVIERNWDLYVRIRARINAGWDGSNAPIIEDILRATHTPASARAMNAAIRDSDPTPFLSEIKSPTLVLYRLGNRAREDAGRLYASRIAGAQLVVVREPSIGPFPNENGVDAMLNFLSPEREYWWQPENRDQLGSGLRVILFTDLENHTVMMQRLGDEQGRAVLREHEIITREALAAYGGSEVKTMGDSFMASFGSATRALECAIAIQKAFADRNATTDEPLSVRVGLSAGEPIAEDEDLFGTSVILASRIAAQAKGGEIVLANVVRELAAGKGFLFSDRGEVGLRGFEDPVRLYDLRWDGAK
jgi:class 3 adenylate cyclase/pimeloyl-ACP methyl ester carboxylesterase